MDLKNTQHQIIIIGSGPAGLTAGIYAARARLAPLIIEGPNPGGQLMGTSLVENWPGEKAILGSDLIFKLKEHARHAGCAFLDQSVKSIDVSRKPFVVTTHRGNAFNASALIICSGASPRRLGCPGEDTYWGRGITTCAVCDAALYKDKKVIVVGGGDTAMESVISLSQYTKDIVLVQILDHLSASAAMQERFRALPYVKTILESTITAVEGNGTTLNRVIIRQVRTGVERVVAADGLFLAIGNQPNTQFLASLLQLDEYGDIQTFNGTQTSVEGIFAAGDVMDGRYRQAITSAGTGCMAALDAERYLRMIQ